MGWQPPPPLSPQTPSHPQHTLSHLFYLLLLPQRPHPSPVCWLEQPFLPPSTPAVPLSKLHSFSCSLTLSLSLCLPQICSHTIHLYPPPSFFSLHLLPEAELQYEAALHLDLDHTEQFEEGGWILKFTVVHSKTRKNKTGDTWRCLTCKISGVYIVCVIVCTLIAHLSSPCQKGTHKSNKRDHSKLNISLPCQNTTLS